MLWWLLCWCFVFATFWLSLPSGSVTPTINGVYSNVDSGFVYHLKRIIFRLILGLRKVRLCVSICFPITLFIK